jgi:Glutathione S-transferase, N-terminal domain
MKPGVTGVQTVTLPHMHDVQQASAETVFGASTAALPRLLVLAGSHYCERVMWACEARQYMVQRVVLAPGLHVLALRRAAPELTSTQLPVLLGPGASIQGSDAILDLIGYPVIEQTAETALVATIGPLVRRAFYAALCGEADLARDWVASAYAPAPRWLRGLTALAPRTLLSALLWRDNARVADLPRLLNALAAAGAALSPSAETELARINNCASQANPQPLSRLAITCGALLAPLLLPAPVPWHRAPWPADLRPRVDALQALPLWQLAHRAWQLRRQTAPDRYPDPDGFASTQAQNRQRPARGPAAGDRDSA